MDLLPNELLLQILAEISPRSLLTISNSCKRIKYLLQAFPEIYHRAAKKLYPAITEASVKNDIVALLLFIKFGSDCSIQIDSTGQTCLHKASHKGFEKQLLILLTIGGNVNVLDNQSKSPLLIASQANQENICFALLSYGANIHLSSKDNHNALMYAVWNGNMKLARTLISYGIDINQTSLNGDSSLFYACQKGNVSMVNLLLDYGANVNHTIRDGWSVLHQAIEQGSILICKLLLERGANVNGIDYCGIAPIHVAIQTQPNPELISLLLDSGADINIQTNSGTTALMKCIMARNIFMAEWLIKRGADSTIPSKSGITCLELARKIDMPRIIHYLECKNSLLFV
jgi:ankyrin repeat protein